MFIYFPIISFITFSIIFSFLLCYFHIYKILVWYTLNSTKPLTSKYEFNDVMSKPEYTIMISYLNYIQTIICLSVRLSRLWTKKLYLSYFLMDFKSYDINRLKSNKLSKCHIRFCCYFLVAKLLYIYLCPSVCQV